MDKHNVIAQPGDWIEIHGHHTGQAARHGEVLEVLGTPGHEHYRVRWDETHESIFFPGEDARVVPKEQMERVAR
jgi:hypothetical protein